MCTTDGVRIPLIAVADTDEIACTQGETVRVLFVTDNFPPETNAAASRVYERALYWVEAGHGVTVITCQPNFPFGKPYDGYRNRWLQVEQVNGIRVVRVKSYMAPNEGRIRRTLDFISFGISATVFGSFESRPDVVVATSPQFFSAIAGWLLSVVKRRPFVFELGDLWPASIKAVGVCRDGAALRAIEAVELFLYRRSAAVIALTEAFKKDLVGRSIPEEKVHVVRNGADLKRFRPQPRDERLADDLGLSGKFVVGYIGTHGMAHGMDKLLDLIESLEDRPDIRFLFVGAGAAKAKMVRDAEIRGLDNVVFVDSQPKTRIARYWSLCDVALVPLADRPVFSTVIPSKLFETMAMGVPVLFFGPRGEASSIVEDEGTGVVVAPPTVPVAAASLRRFADDPAFHGSMAAAALEASRSHSRALQAQQVLEVLSNAVEPHAGTAEAGRSERAMGFADDADAIHGEV